MSFHFTSFDSCDHFCVRFKRLYSSSEVTVMKMIRKYVLCASTVSLEAGLWSEMESSPFKQILALAKL